MPHTIITLISHFFFGITFIQTMLFVLSSCFGTIISSILVALNDIVSPLRAGDLTEMCRGLVIICSMNIFHDRNETFPLSV